MWNDQLSVEILGKAHKFMKKKFPHSENSSNAFTFCDMMD